MHAACKMNRIVIGWLPMFLSLVLCRAGEITTPKYFGVAPGALAQVKKCLDRGEKTFAPALEALVHDADRALRVTPPSVMDKTRLPPSGDKHDYMSTAPYFWPDPSRSNGLPYIRHDGKVNPESRSEASDHDRLGRMAGAVQTLALAYYFTAREPYAAHASRLLAVWFLDPATRMKPNMNFAQGVPGVNTGRGTGVLEGRSVVEAADSAQLLAGSKAWTPNDDDALHAWLGEFLDWLLTSKNGRDEAAARNNHGTFYDMQVLRLALVLGKTDLAKQIAAAAGAKRVATQIEPDGRQPLELQRTAALGYSAFNVQALFALATAAEYVGSDLWHHQTSDGRSIRTALDFLLPYVDLPARKWPYEQIKPFDPVSFAPILRQASIVYHEPKYEHLLAKYAGVGSKRFQLLCPPENPGSTTREAGHP